MSTSIGSAGVTFPDSTVQTSASFPAVYGQVFTSSGTFTIPTGVTALKVTVVGGGGAGASASPGNNGTGGGGGATAISYLTSLTPANTIAVTVGGTNGGQSKIASGTQTITTVTANGGSGGSTGTNAGGNGGTASGGTINITGQKGGLLCMPYDSTLPSGSGGSSLFGLGAPGISTPSSPTSGNAGTGYGGGGSGGASGGGEVGTGGGGTGSQGVVFFEW